MNLDALPEKFRNLTLAQLLAQHNSLDRDTSRPFSSSPSGAYHGYSQPSRGTHMMRYSGCPSLSRSSGDLPMRLSHSFSPHYSDRICPSMGHHFDSREVMRIEAYEGYEALLSDAFTDKMMKLMQQFSSEKKHHEELDAKFTKMGAEFDSKISDLTSHIQRLESRVQEIQIQAGLNRVNIDEHGSRFYCMKRNMHQLEEHLEWNIEALQQGFNNPNDYTKWKNEQDYLIHDKKEEERVLREEFAAKAESVEWSEDKDCHYEECNHLTK